MSAMDSEILDPGFRTDKTSVIDALDEVAELSGALQDVIV